MVDDIDVQIVLRNYLVTMPGLPASRQWENDYFKPVAGVPFVSEEYVPGPRKQRGVGPLGKVDRRPTYIVKIHQPVNSKLAARVSADAVVAHFPMRTKWALTDGSELRVRADAGPLPGQMLPSEPGFVAVPVSIYLQIWTNNSI